LFHSDPRFIDKASEVAPSDVHSDADVTSSVFAIDRSASESCFDSSQCFQWNDGSRRYGYAHFPDFLDVIARRKGESHHDIEAEVPVPIFSHGNAPKRGLENMLKFSEVESVSG